MKASFSAVFIIFKLNNAFIGRHNLAINRIIIFYQQEQACSYPPLI